MQLDCVSWLCGSTLILEMWFHTIEEIKLMEDLTCSLCNESRQFVLTWSPLFLFSNSSDFTLHEGSQGLAVWDNGSCHGLGVVFLFAFFTPLSFLRSSASLLHFFLLAPLGLFLFKASSFLSMCLLLTLKQGKKKNWEANARDRVSCFRGGSTVTLYNSL